MDELIQDALTRNPDRLCNETLAALPEWVARPRYDRSALKAIRKWRFKPKKQNGRAVSRRATQIIEFSLSDR